MGKKKKKKKKKEGKNGISWNVLLVLFVRLLYSGSYHFDSHDDVVTRLITVLN